MSPSDADVALVLTFHGEGELVPKTLSGAKRCLSAAHLDGVRTECIAVLDNADARTRALVLASDVPSLVVETAAGDAGEARNAGIAASNALWITVCDGDDYLSANWIARSYALGRATPDAVLHPEYLVNFGQATSFQKAYAPGAETLPDEALFGFNPWSVWSMARRDVFLKHPYRATKTSQTGFGYEDWHWHLETLAAGHPHRVVPQTAGFYRRKAEGRFLSESLDAALLRPTAFFAPSRFGASARLP